MVTNNERRKDLIVAFITEYRKAHEGLVSPTLTEIADELGFSYHTAHRAVKELEQDGRLKRIAPMRGYICV